MTALLFKHSTSQAYGKKMHTMTDVIFLPFIAEREQSDPCRSGDPHLRDNWGTGRHKTMQTHVVLPL